MTRPSLRQLTTCAIALLPIVGISCGSSEPLAPATPSAPTIDAITVDNLQLSVAFTTANDGGAPITTYQYSTDNGTTWRTRQTGTTASPLVISTLSNDGATALAHGTAYLVRIRAVNVVGNSTQSNAVSATPALLAPLPSAGHALVFHDALKAVLLVNAGLGSSTQPAPATKSVLWQWTGQKWTVLDSEGPPIRNLAGVAYDSKRNALVMFGGSYDQNLVYDETWEWLQSTGWVRRNVAGPGKRDHTQMAYDAVRERVVLFGGQIGTSSFPSDTWTWDGQSWQQVASTGPSGRVHHSMIYDAVGARVLAFGGTAPNIGDQGDTWSWSGTAWSAAASPTSPRTHARLGVLSRGIILLGGFPASSTPRVLLLENGAWRIDDQPNVPSARYLTALAFDPLRKVTVLFGGGDPSSNTLYNDTWEFDATSGWRRITP
jgi:hypothetical protein